MKEHNFQPFNISILKGTFFGKNMHMISEAFKNNTPSVINFEIRKEKHLNMLYIKQNDDTEYGQETFGPFVTGKTLTYSFSIIFSFTK